MRSFTYLRTYTLEYIIYVKNNNLKMYKGFRVAKNVRKQGKPPLSEISIAFKYWFLHL